MQKNKQGRSEPLNKDWTKILDRNECRRAQNRIAQRNYRKRLKKRLGHVVQETRCSRAFSEEKPTELQSTNSHVEESRSQALLEPEHDHSTPEMQGRSLLIFPKESLYNISPFGAGYAMMAGIEIPSLDTEHTTSEGFPIPNVKSQDNEQEVSLHMCLAKREWS